MSNPKSIDTLVDDIYALFDPAIRSPDSFSNEGVQRFGESLSRTISSRITEPRRDGYLRLSQVGTECQRKLWYTVNAPGDAEQLTSDARLKFLFGDILEALLLFLAKEAGHDVRGEQTQVEVQGVKGHRDAIIDGRLVDVKSASSISFKKFQSNGLLQSDPFGYLGQIRSYYRASEPELGDTGVASFLVVDKTLGKLTLDTYPITSDGVDEMVTKAKETVALPEPPTRGYEDVPEGKSGNRKLCTQCGYCPFKRTCWPQMRTFIYSKGPVFLTDVKKIPKVWEIDANGYVIQDERFMGTESPEPTSIDDPF